MDCPALPLFATELELGDAARNPSAVRWELFLFRDVRDVLPGPRPGSVVVFHSGLARPDAWRAELQDAGLLSGAWRGPID